MKQYLNDEQTAKLMELGFEKPTMKNIFTPEGEVNEEWYSIGELIEILDNIPSGMWAFAKTSAKIVKVEMLIFPETKCDTYFYKVCYNKELVDALFVMIIKLKEEGVI